MTYRKFGITRTAVAEIIGVAAPVDLVFVEEKHLGLVNAPVEKSPIALSSGVVIRQNRLDIV
jgi:hypothetical protein